MFKRFWLVIRSWFGAGLDRMEDPERLLMAAQREMNALHAENRDRAIEAITRKNNLQNTLEQMEKRAQQAQRIALAAEGGEDAEVARRLRREAEELRRVLEEARQQLAEAVATAEEVKRAIRDEETKVRQRIEERLTRLNFYSGRAIDLEIRRQMKAMGLWDDRQQVPPPEVTPRDLIIALAAWILFAVAVSFVGAWIRTR